MNFGLSKPVIAKRNNDGTYSDGFLCGKAINTTVSPAYNEGSVYGDNALVINRKKFKNAAVTLGTTSLPAAAASTMFGHTIDATGAEVRNIADEANEVGYGFVSEEVNESSLTVYIGCVLLRVLFAEAENSYKTEGDSIEFSTPNLNGTAMGDSSGNWLKRKPFSTEAEAYDYIQGILGVTDKCVNPTVSVPGGTYAAAQSVVLSCTDGGSVWYTLDGTTPSATNGTKYVTTPISITARKMLKAINVKTGKADSDVVSMEYIISGS